MGNVVCGQITQNLCHFETGAQNKPREVLSGGELAQQAPQCTDSTQEQQKEMLGCGMRGSVARN